MGLGVPARSGQIDLAEVLVELDQLEVVAIIHFGE
jgi:hypothetical protein